MITDINDNDKFERLVDIDSVTHILTTVYHLQNVCVKILLMQIECSTDSMLKSLPAAPSDIWIDLVAPGKIIIIRVEILVSDIYVRLHLFLSLLNYHVINICKIPALTTMSLIQTNIQYHYPKCPTYYHHDASVGQ